MLDPVVGVLACPHCAAALDRDDRVLRCRNGHLFDIARQGYVSLLGARSRTDTGDSAEMVAARVAFLGAGHYAPIAAQLARVVAAQRFDMAQRSGAARRPEVAVEVGAGTGYYLAAVLEEVTTAVGIAIDSSVRAARRAATAHPALGSVVADAWTTLPLQDGCADSVLSVFAPRNPAELARILRPDGLLAVVTPAPDHLGELIGPLGMLTVDGDKDVKLAASLGDHFAHVDAQVLRFGLQLDRAGLRHLVLMGPAARHLRPMQLEDSLDQLAAATVGATTVTAAVKISQWRPSR